MAAFYFLTLTFKNNKQRGFDFVQAFLINQSRDEEKKLRWMKMIKSSFVVANATVTNVVYQYGVKLPVL